MVAFVDNSIFGDELLKPEDRRLKICEEEEKSMRLSIYILILGFQNIC